MKIIKGYRYSDKLVRNKIPEIIEKDGNKTALCKFIDSVDKYKLLLWEKLFEEMDEAESAAAGHGCESEEYDEDKLIEELADIYEVYRTIMDVYHIRKSDVIARMLKKQEERGDFSGRVYLIGVIEHGESND